MTIATKMTARRTSRIAGDNVQAILNILFNDSDSEGPAFDNAEDSSDESWEPDEEDRRKRPRIQRSKCRLLEKGGGVVFEVFVYQIFDTSKANVSSDKGTFTQTNVILVYYCGFC